jgi:hypothetical protein
MKSSEPGSDDFGTYSFRVCIVIVTTIRCKPLKTSSRTMAATSKAPLNLQTLTKLSLSLGVRDKLIKSIQYAARIVVGYYGPHLSEKTMKSLQVVSL